MPAQPGESADQMRRNKADKLPRRDDLRILPERREVLPIARDEIVGTSCIGALDKDVVVRIARHFEAAGWRNQVAVVLNQLKQLETQPPANGQFGTGQYIPVFFKDWRGDVQASRRCIRQHECGALDAVGFHCRRDHDSRIYHHTQRKYQRFFFSVLAALMT